MTLPAVLVAAVSLAGCFPVLIDESATQQDLIGDVKVSGQSCPSPMMTLTVMQFLLSEDVRNAREARPEFCMTRENILAGLRDNGDGLPAQVLVAFRVPKGVKAPSSFTATSDVALVEDVVQTRRGLRARGSRRAVQIREDHVITFRRAPELDAQMPAYIDRIADVADRSDIELLGEGHEVVGYISDRLPGAALDDFAVEAPFALPAGADASAPYAGPFDYMAMMGSRIALSDDQWAETGIPGAADAPNRLSADRPVVCPTRAVLEQLNEEAIDEVDVVGLAFCPLPAIDDDALEPVEGSSVLAGTLLETRDLRISGGEGIAEQGQTAVVPFTVRTAGAAAPDSSLGLTAGTALAGGTASPDAAQMAFSPTSATARSVTVAVPADAAPGTYAVTLSATVGGTTRTGTGTVVVLPRPPAPQTVAPSVAPSITRDTVYMDRKGYITFGWKCPPVCGNAQVDVAADKAGISPRSAVEMPRLLRIGRGKFRAPTGKQVRVKVKLGSKARRAVRNGRQVKALLIVRKGGKGTPSVRRVVITRR